MAAIWDILLLRTYLKGHKFTARKDGDALKGISTLADAIGRWLRLKIRLS